MFSINYTPKEKGYNPWNRVYPLDAGYDLITYDDTIVRGRELDEPFSVTDIRTGLCIEMPPELYARITGRSSAVRNTGLLVVESTIDGDYRGEITFGVMNMSIISKLVKKGTRLAQIVFSYNLAPLVHFVERDILSHSPRGSKGFGSTGGFDTIEEVK